MLILVALLFWTGGSFFMRMQFWPSIKVWFDISILGLLLLGFALFNFAYQYVGCKNRAVQLFWLMTTVVINLINICTGVFLREPELVETASGQTSFVYNTTWPVVAFFIFCTAIIAHMFVLLFRYFKDHEVARRQFHPVLVGIGFMFLGHIAFIFPFFKGIPTDIIAGVPFAFCIFYALYRRRLFRLTLLASRGSCYALSGGAVGDRVHQPPGVRWPFHPRPIPHARRIRHPHHRFDLHGVHLFGLLLYEEIYRQCVRQRGNRAGGEPQGLQPRGLPAASKSTRS